MTGRYKGRAIASFPYFPFGRVEKREWEDRQEGEQRRQWQSERLVECFLSKGIFEAAKASHQRKQILLGVERKLSVAQRIRSLRRQAPSLLVSFSCSSLSKFMLHLVVSVNIVKLIAKIIRHRFFFRCSSVDAKVCVVSRGISKEAEQNTVTAQPCKCTDVPESETQSIGTKCVCCVCERETGEREREREREREKIELFIFPQQDLSKTERVTHCGKGTHRSYNVKLQLGQSVG